LRRRFFRHLGLPVEDEGGGIRFVQDLQFLGDHLDLAGIEGGIDHVSGTPVDLSPDGQDELAPYGVCQRVRLRPLLRIEDDLDGSFPIPEVDEDQSAEVSAPVDPPHEDDL